MPACLCKIAGALLTIAVLAVTGEGVRCYWCRNGRSNEECNSGIKQICEQWNHQNSLGGYACEVEVFNVYGRKIMKKRCIEASQCYNPNVTYCDEDNTRCTYCCKGDLCNKGEKPAQQPLTTQAPVTVTNYQSFWVTVPHKTTSTLQHTVLAYPTLPGGIPPQGPPGPKGSKGQPGLPGIKGARGVPGPHGSPGLPGKTGSSLFGPKGDQGSIGPEGPKGNTGEVLISQLKGEKGQRGDHGSRGADGIKGQTGECSCDALQFEATVSFSVSASDVEQTSDYYQHVTISDVITNVTNVGMGISRQYMDFRAPVRGLYVFHVTSIANGNGAVPLVMIRDENEKILTTARTDRSATGLYPVGTGHAILSLEEGDTVSVLIREKRSGFFWGLVDPYSPSDVKFSGYLLTSF